MKKGVDGHVTGGQSGGVRSGGTLAGLCPPTLDGHDGLAPADAPGDPGEAPRVAEGLQVEQDYLGGSVAFPVLQEVVARNVGPIADADKTGDAQVETIGSGQEGQPERSTLGRHGDIPTSRK